MLDWLETIGAWMAQAPRAWLAAALGAAALALLSKRRAHPAALALLGAGLFAAAAEFAHRAGGDAPLLGKALAALFAGLALAAGTGLAAGRNPLYAALSFAVAALGFAGLFLMLGATFLAAATVIVYAGAIIVTFVFVIMLASNQNLAGYDATPWNPVPAAIAAALFAGTAFTVVERNFRTSPASLLFQRLERLDVALDDPATAPQTEPRAAGVPFDEALRRQINELPDRGRRAAFGKELVRLSGAWRKSWGLPPRPADWLEAGGGDDAAPAGTPERGPALVAARNLAGMASALARDQRDAFGMTPANLVPHAREAPRWREHRSPLAQRNAADAGSLQPLGRALWGDYLMGVEIAGTLLLLAAIGAIAINQSPREASA